MPTAADPAGSPPPRDPAARVVSIAVLGVLVLVLVGLLSTGLVLRISAWWHTGLVGPEPTDALVDAHVLAAALFAPLSFAVLVLPRALQCKSPARSAAALVGGALLVLASPLALVPGLVNALTGGITLVPALFGLVAGVGCAGVLLAASRRDLTTVAGWAVILAMFAESALDVYFQLALGLDFSRSTVLAPLAWLTLFALVVCIEPLLERASHPVLALAVSLIALSFALPYLNIPEEIPRFLRVVAFGVVLLAALAIRAAWRSSARLDLRLAALAAVLASGPTWLLVPGFAVDVMLADTTVEAGIVHLRVLAIACAWLATRTWPSEPRAPSRSLALSGLALFVLGGLTFSWLLIALGARGMPLHYASYPAPLEPLQRGATAGALVALVGALMLVITMLRGMRARS